MNSRNIMLALIGAFLLLVATAIWGMVATASTSTTIIFVAGATCAALLAIGGLILLQRQCARVNEIHSAIQRLSPQNSELDQVAAALDRIHARIVNLEAERDGLKATLTTMEEGVIVVDAQKHILMANAAARKILNMPSREPVGAHLIEMTSQPELLTNVELSLVA